jgi:hypothetical protein
VRLGETAQADVTLTETAEQERKRPGIRTAEAALRLTQGNPRAATTALASVVDSSAPGNHRLWLERHARQRTAHAALIRKIIGVLGGRTPAAPAAVPSEHLYDKLGVHRRLEAIDRARTLGLLAPVPQRALKLISAGQPSLGLRLTG